MKKTNLVARQATHNDTTSLVAGTPPAAPSKNWGDLPTWTFDSVRVIMEALRIVDISTYEHCLRVGEICRKLSRDMGLNEFEQRVSQFSGMLHDIGKMGIEKGILNKPSRLTELEYDVMKSHPILSEEIIKPLSQDNKFVELILPGVRGHHERFDGMGYPDKLTADQIPLVARVIFVADTYDAMKNTRSYRSSLPVEAIYAELKRCAGSQFDIQIVKTFLEAHPTWDDSTDIDHEVNHRIIKRAA